MWLNSGIKTKAASLGVGRGDGPGEPPASLSHHALLCAFSTRSNRLSHNCAKTHNGKSYLASIYQGLTSSQPVINPGSR